MTWNEYASGDKEQLAEYVKLKEVARTASPLHDWRVGIILAKIPSIPEIEISKTVYYCIVCRQFIGDVADLVTCSGPKPA